MIPSNDLFLLIKALSSNEKRSFSIYAKKHVIGKKNQYEALFEDMGIYCSANSEYNEEDFRKKHKSKMYIKSFSDSKNTLLNQIIESLTSVKNEESAEQTITKYFYQINIFKEKKLDNLWHKTIIRAKTLAYKHEFWGLYSKILKEEYYYHLSKNHSPNNEIFENFKKEKEEAVVKITYHENIEIIKEQLYFFVQKIGASAVTKADLSIIENAINNHFIQTHTLGHSFSIDLNYNYAYYFYYYIKKDYKSSLIYANNIYQLINKNRTLIDGEKYISICCNHIMILLQNEQWEDAYTIISEVKQIVPKNENERISIQDIILYEIFYALNVNKYEQITAMEKNIYQYIQLKHNEKNIATKSSILYNLSLAFFKQKNWKKCISTIQNFSTQEANNSNLSLRFKTKLLECICYFDSGQLDILQNELRNIVRSKSYNGIKESDCWIFFELLSTLLKSDNYTQTIKAYTHSQPNILTQDNEFSDWVIKKLYRA